MENGCDDKIAKIQPAVNKATWLVKLDKKIKIPLKDRRWKSFKSKLNFKLQRILKPITKVTKQEVHTHSRTVSKHLQ